MIEVIHSAFGARRRVDPPSDADGETAETLAAKLRRGSGIFAQVEGRPAGVIVVLPVPDAAGTARFSRVSVHPDLQRHGITSTMVAAAEELAAIRGFERVELLARTEFGEFITFWQHRGFVVDRQVNHGVMLAKPLPLAIKVPTSEAMVRLGERLAKLLERGDVILAAGDLGAGKTTLTRGIGRGLGSEGPIISPTFVLSRLHPSGIGRPTLMHVDAYRLATASDRSICANAHVQNIGWQGWHCATEGEQVTPPEGRTAIFLGDLVDRGPNSPAVLRLVMNMVRAGTALCVPGNHDMKLVKKLSGKNVKIGHGLAETPAPDLVFEHALQLPDLHRRRVGGGGRYAAAGSAGGRSRRIRRPRASAPPRACRVATGLPCRASTESEPRALPADEGAPRPRSDSHRHAPHPGGL